MEVGNVRFQLEMSAKDVEDLNKLMERLGLRTKRELFDNALTLLKWAVEQREHGGIIASVDKKTDTYRELSMPALDGIQKK